MLSRLKIRPLILSVCMTMWLASCGGGSSNSSDANNNNVSEPYAPTAKVIIYFTSIFQLGNASDTVDTTVHQYIPDTGELLTVEFSQSFSFAKSSLFARSFDDNLVTLRNTGSSGFSGGTWKIKDLEAEKDSSAVEFPAAFQQSTNEGNSRSNCVAIANDRIYWLSPEIGGGLKTIAFSDYAFSENLLIASTQANACYEEVITGGQIGGMDYADGVWYSTRFDQGNGLIEFFTRDLTTGTPTTLASISATDHAQYDSRYTFGFDNGKAYWARVHATTNVIEVWQYDFTGTAQNLLTTTLSGLTPTAVTELDVDDGFVVFKIIETSIIGDTAILLFDINTTTSTIINLLDLVPAIGGLLPPTFRDINVMYRQP